LNATTILCAVFVSVTLFCDVAANPQLFRGLIVAAVLHILWLKWVSTEVKKPLIRTATEGSDEPIRWTFLHNENDQNPGVYRANELEPKVWENEYAKLKVVALHRPTHNPAAETNGEYPYAWHFNGRKRLWEVRIQAIFKQKPEYEIMFGIQQDEYTPVSKFGSMTLKMLNSMCTSVVGDGIYTSPGEDPETTEGEAEPTTFAMPLWACDQLIVSKTCEEPDLTGDLNDHGMKRANGIRDYCKHVEKELSNISPNKTYTFCVWGISQFLDCVHWQIVKCVPGRQPSFDVIGGSVPMNIVCYEIRKDKFEHDDKRHLVSRRKYIFSMVMWSAFKPPTSDILKKLKIPDEHAAALKRVPQQKANCFPCLPKDRQLLALSRWNSKRD